MLGAELSFTDMVVRSGVPGNDETGDGDATAETTRFGLYPRRLWDGLLQFEKVAIR